MAVKSPNVTKWLRKNIIRRISSMNRMKKITVLGTAVLFMFGL